MSRERIWESLRRHCFEEVEFAEEKVEEEEAEAVLRTLKVRKILWTPLNPLVWNRGRAAVEDEGEIEGH